MNRVYNNLQQHFQSFLILYRSFFSVKEIEESVTLKWVFGSIIFSHFTTFFAWFYNESTTIDAVNEGLHMCPPYFQSCGEWFFLQTLPYGYSQPMLYMVFFTMMFFSVQAMWKRDWSVAHMLIMPLFLWHAFVILFMSDVLAVNYQYYLMLFSLVLLVFPHKLFFLQLSVVILYVLSVVSKIHESWILGTYFSSLKIGLPFFPKWSIPLWTNLVMLMELVGAWFLMSGNRPLQRSALVFFVVFHIYSGLLVGFRYPSIVLPVVYILFGPMFKTQKIPLDRKSILGWIFILLLFGLQFISNMIPGDEKLTQEGNKFGQYMFESNHQCISTTEVTYVDGNTEQFVTEISNAVVRCNPYNAWFRINQVCKISPEIASIAWTFDHSINGNAFLRIVDVPNACAVPYQPFAHNDWIKTEKDSPEIIGYPVENIYR